ncbi:MULTISPECIES: hypothetical protein [unclassified Shewanella]|uniref:hypothetical protein n=1 Tax=unclassified Shewanella TaxID=196818 RepID=UPI001BBF9DD2|nr:MULTISPECIES: hypothetical protein [unclassified Shewanella]GIU07634.1 hypothetical protein TUM4444_07370 [Shewanella sp. MBTL60-112-B1]GIU30238.1 hypothetical protein TUM4445_13360 [Shewanella sp. MBTL60-112-B2]
MNSIVTLKANLASALNKQRLAEERQQTLNRFNRLLDHSLNNANAQVTAARTALAAVTHKDKAEDASLYDTLCSGNYADTSFLKATAAVIGRAVVR